LSSAAAISSRKVVMDDGTVSMAVNPRTGRSQVVLLEHVINPYQHKLEAEIQSLLRQFSALAAAKSGVRYSPPEA
jgi:CDP-diacylglycerol pyrophosphatase